jgi:hypothetical protein
MVKGQKKLSVIRQDFVIKEAEEKAPGDYEFPGNVVGPNASQASELENCRVINRDLVKKEAEEKATGDCKFPKAARGEGSNHVRGCS